MALTFHSGMAKKIRKLTRVRQVCTATVLHTMSVSLEVVLIVCIKFPCHPVIICYAHEKFYYLLPITNGIWLNTPSNSITITNDENSTEQIES